MHPSPLYYRYLLSAIMFALFSGVSFGQGEWIRRLDDDNNGYIEPDEISERSRRYLEDFAIPYGLSLSRPNSVKKLEQAARLHAERRERAGSPTLPPPAEVEGLKGFGVDPEKPLVPGFGLREVKYPYTQADLDEAASMLRRWDRDGDGKLDPQEIERARWDGHDPLDSDFDQDRSLTKLELSQRYARRRLESQRPIMSVGSLNEGVPRRDEGQEIRDRRDRMRAGSSLDGDRGSASLADSILERYDFNRNGQLDPQEMSSVGISIAKVDYDRNGAVDENEFARYLNEELDREANASQEAIPTWFFERDGDGDKQVVMSEFTQEWDDAKLEEFASYDHNHDGIITIDEVLTSQTVAGGEFSNSQAHLLLPRSTVVSEIEIADDYLIGDLNVQLSITHTYTEQLDGYLIGPDGQRIELFTGVGGSDDHFDKTIFDDDNGERITRSRAPFRGTFRPEALEKRQPGLNHYKGKNLKGTWQLMIRASRSERSGVLHGWSLLVKPDQEAVDNPDSVSERLTPMESIPSEESSETEDSTFPAQPQQ
ncbi:calcium sensor EFh [Blastopirellula marina]|uniref:Calcium sensor EFh n=1 Tax=Blastopirellula marina TaxID=124 RepID=A0A2S8F0Z1_9BACT|nr:MULTISPECIES: proprotein convertase P-domain-containing protein [Pirellulaceae]PQO25803.1 calcium sensor EFh [Blastopirellula marina]RCS43486.1 calcium sensor EFh [Bremerella cremea]